MAKHSPKTCSRGQKSGDPGSRKKSSGVEGIDDPAVPSEHRIVRASRGRFAPDFCPNPKGRPPKQADAEEDILLRSLAELLPNAAPGSPGPTWQESIVRAVLLGALKDPKLGLSILKVCQAKRPLGGTRDRSDFSKAEDEAFNHYLERRDRRKAREDELSRSKKNCAGGQNDNQEEGS